MIEPCRPSGVNDAISSNFSGNLAGNRKLSTRNCFCPAFLSSFQLRRSGQHRLDSHGRGTLATVAKDGRFPRDGSSFSSKPHNSRTRPRQSLSSLPPHSVRRTDPLNDSQGFQIADDEINMKLDEFTQVYAPSNSIESVSRSN